MGTWIATLDQLAAGRLIVGVGVGWLAEAAGTTSTRAARRDCHTQEGGYNDRRLAGSGARARSER
jgi:alkanesulfonate monooxygenase SsuD/methylene tetrahydromethanopterin reductase-like flavin-dependent oxidoreductase (luciferase family)